ncbi:MAG TPA: hypothetical protein VF507_07250 [Pyrinomonadaceae bacterium]
MRRKIAYLIAPAVVALSVTVSLLAPTTKVGAQGSSCNTHCRISYNRCVANATNPGGLNHCGKTYQACLATCQ